MSMSDLFLFFPYLFSRKNFFFTFLEDYYVSMLYLLILNNEDSLSIFQTVSTCKPQKDNAHLIFLAEDLMRCYVLESFNKCMFSIVYSLLKGDFAMAVRNNYT